MVEYLKGSVVILREELERKLTEAFSIYRPNDEREPFCLFGFEVNDGWFDLLWELSEKIQNEVDKLDKEKKEDFYVLQVKEKYGTLRYYTSFITDEIDAAISQAEDKSYEICEICGKAGRLNEGGWYAVRCKEHWKV